MLPRSTTWRGGLISTVANVELPVGGRRITDGDSEGLLHEGKDAIDPEGRMILHATSGLEHRYFVHDGDVLYRYQPDSYADRIPAGAEEEA